MCALAVVRLRLRPHLGQPSLLSHTMYLLIDVRKSTPPQNRQLIVLISVIEQHVVDFVEELTF